MTKPRQARTLVLGLGNPVLSDDRVGLAVVERVEERLRDVPQGNVDVATSLRGGFELLELLHGYDRAILVDCVQAAEPQPGRVRRLTLEDVSGCPRLINAHEISLSEVFRLAQHLGLAMPTELLIFAVEGADLETISERMTPEVEAAVEPLVAELVRLVRESPASAAGSAGELKLSLTTGD